MILLINSEGQFDELEFFSKVKKRPGLYIGQTSLLSLRDQLFGMEYAFSFYCQESPLAYLNLFIEWYHREILKDLNGYACWWNHLLYTSGNDDAYAFESFFRIFEQYLRNEHNTYLPEVP